MKNQSFSQKESPIKPELTVRRGLSIKNFALVSSLFFISQLTLADETSYQPEDASAWKTSSTNESSAQFSKNKAAPFALLHFDLASSPETSDYRRELPGGLFTGIPNPENFSSGGSISVMNAKFAIEVLAFEWDNSLAYLAASIPVRSLRYIKNPTRLTTEGTLLTQGSELGGYSGGAHAQLFSLLDLSLFYEEQSSERLKLISAARFVRGELGIKDTLGTGAQIGLIYEMAASVSAPLRSLTPIQYGTHRQAKLNLGIILGSDHATALTLGSKVQLTRTESFLLTGKDLGGGGLGSISPYLEYPLTQSIKIAFRYDIPVIKSLGREEIFRDPSLPGLFGKTFSFALSVM